MPVALAVESKGHDVVGYDISPKVKRIIKEKKIPYKEEFVQNYLKKSKIKFKDVRELVKHSEIIFVPIQTPHDPAYEGVTRIPKKRVDFDYKYLIRVIAPLQVMQHLQFSLFPNSSEFSPTHCL